MDEDNPDRFVGKTILISLRHYDQDRELSGQEQMTGTIRQVDSEHGITVNLDDGSIFMLPPPLWGVADAPPGEYECQSAGRTITNPDFLASWSLYDDPQAADSGPTWKPNHTIVKNARDIDDWKFTYKPDFDRIKRMIVDRGESFVQKHVIIGLRYYKRSGDDEEFVGQEQLHGVIVRVSYSEGIVVQLGPGQERTLPPDLALLQPAPPGEYRLRSTGEVVVDPDYLTTWVGTSSSDEINDD